MEYEARRQVELLLAGERVIQQTRHWDENSGRTSSMRSKEEAEDYRYFPEPDLVPLDPDAEWIERVRAALPVLPAERRHRLAAAAGVTLPSSSVAVLVERGQDTQALAAIEAGADPARVLVHIEQNLAGDGGVDLAPERLAALVKMEAVGALTATQAKQVLAEMIGSDASPEDIALARGFEAMSGDALGSAVDEVIASNPAEWERFRTGDDKARGKLTGFFVGQVMKATRGQADGAAVTKALRERAAS
jgi:aspartyl-tRNA(Asn)/glutamyl-tRNA(Gln) amidotransferase subunit B